ncbi:hypothetical protein ILYODFUR_037407 [Ilyodon furcidens]|uniref:Uncharacterized protein n=1 Tax=Ilyodon furcidens TaxID=33524 RepID=A0ABV0UZL9_9TELE
MSPVDGAAGERTHRERRTSRSMLVSSSEPGVEELRSRQEAEKKKQEESHSQKMEAVKQEYETSIQGLKMIQQTELEDLQKTLKETETSLTVRVKLTAMM